MSGPADQARLGQFSNYGVLRRTGLLEVGGDDFKISSCPKREKGILRAASWVDAAKRSTNARSLLDESDALVEIATAQQNVVEQGRHLIHGPTECRHCKSTTSTAKKHSARHKSRRGQLLRGR